MLKVIVSPSTLPSLIVDLPVYSLLVSPVSLAPSCLNVNDRSMGPFGPSAVPFQFPEISAADATNANTAMRVSICFMLIYSMRFDLRIQALAERVALPLDPHGVFQQHAHD